MAATQSVTAVTLLAMIQSVTELTVSNLYDFLARRSLARRKDFIFEKCDFPSCSSRPLHIRRLSRQCRGEQFSANYHRSDFPIIFIAVLHCESLHSLATAFVKLPPLSRRFCIKTFAFVYDPSLNHGLLRLAFR